MALVLLLQCLLCFGDVRCAGWEEAVEGGAVDVVARFVMLWGSEVFWLGGAGGG